MAATMEHQPIGPSGHDFFGIPVERDILFLNHKNTYKKRIEKRQTKLIEKLAFIKPFLKEGEKIVLVTSGCSPVSILEQLVTGWIVFYLKQALFVFTNKRIFHVPTKANYSYRNSIAHILYADCRSIVMKGRTLVVTYKNGKQEKFFYVAGRERKKIKTLLPTLPLEGAQSTTPERTHLCPRCTKELIKEKYICPHCHCEFKDEGEAKKISIVYPGGGYFYTRHPFLGIGDAFAEFFLLVLVILSFIGVIQGVEGSGVGFVVFGVGLAFEKVITVYHANHFIKEYIPKEKEIRPVAATSTI